MNTTEGLDVDSTIRELVDGDWDSVAALMNCYETYGTTGDILRQRNALWSDGDPRMRLVATDSNNDLIGYCRSARRASEPPGIFRIAVYVSPQSCGKGLGRHFLGKAEHFAKQHGAKSILTTVELANARSVDFAERCGYGRSQHLFESRLDVISFDIVKQAEAKKRLEAEGFQFTNLEEFGDTAESWRALHELDTETDRDTPGSENWSLGPADEYAEQQRTSYGFTAPGVILAVREGRFVGVNIVKDSPNEGEWATDYTGVRKECRGKGLAHVLKSLGIDYAKQMGARVMVTNNDERNAPMLAVNRKLGFEPQAGFYVVKKTL